MKNGRRNSNNNSKRRTERTAESVTNGSNTGDVIGTIDREQPTDAGENLNIRDETERNSGIIEADAERNKQFTLPSGYYFTPTGDVERIPDGHYIHNGRLRKRRAKRSDGDSTTDGNEDRNRTEAGNESRNSGDNNFWEEKPLKVRGSRKFKKSKISEATQRATLVGMLTVASTMLFDSVSLITKHKHWQLETEEAKILGESMNEMLATLPNQSYDRIIAIIEKWFPRVNFTFVIGSLIVPRINESIKQFEDRNYRKSKISDTENVRTENNSWINEQSLGFGE